MKHQVEQELSDKDIIIEDMNKLREVKIKLISEGKQSFKQKLYKEHVIDKKKVQPNQTGSKVSAAEPLLQKEQTRAERRKTIDLRNNANRRSAVKEKS